MDIININGNSEYQKKVAGAEKTIPVRNDQKVNGFSDKLSADEVNVSSQAKLMHNIRKKLDEIDAVNREQKVAELKEKMAEGLHKLSSEEIVTEILRGTLFEAY